MQAKEKAYYESQACQQRPSPPEPGLHEKSNATTSNLLELEGILYSISAALFGPRPENKSQPKEAMCFDDQLSMQAQKSGELLSIAQHIHNRL